MSAQSVLNLEPVLVSDLETSPLTVRSAAPAPAAPAIARSASPTPSLTLPEPAALASPSVAASRSAANNPVTSSVSLASISFANGNSMSNAHSIGTLVASDAAAGTVHGRSLTGRVREGDAIDYIRFNAQQHFSLDAMLSNLQANADLRLIRDVNNNGRVDAGDAILGSFKSGTQSEVVSVNGLGAGTYFLEVKNVNGSDTSYSLNISARAGIPGEIPGGLSGDTPSQAIPITGQLNGIRSFLGNVNSSNDPVDIYRFTINQAVTFASILSGLTSDANLILYADTNKNRVLESSEVVAISARPGNTTEAFSKEVLTPGDYYLQINRPSSLTGGTNYRLDLNATPFETATVTLDIHEIKALAQFDTHVPWTNWKQADFFGTVKINGQTHRFGTIQDRDRITDLKFTQTISSSQQLIDVEIEVFDEDGLIDDAADIAPELGAIGIKFQYDVVAQRGVGISGFSRSFVEGERVPLRGTNGDLTLPNSIVNNTHAAEINFSINYTPIL